MKKCCLTSALILLFVCTMQAQRPMLKADSIRLATLKKQLPGLKDSFRVNCLNDLAREYAWLEVPQKSTGDSLYHYATLANKEALKLNYQYGIAFSYLHLASHQRQFRKAKETSDSLTRIALSIGEKINNPQILGWANYGLWELKKAVSYFRLAGDAEGEAEACTWLSYEYLLNETYEPEGFSYCQRAVALSGKPWTHTISWGRYISQFALENMATLYQRVGDYETAMGYVRKAQQYQNESHYSMEWYIGDLFKDMRQYDSALHYLKINLENTDEKSSTPLSKAIAINAVGEVYLLMKDYGQAKPYFEKAMAIVGNSRPRIYPAKYATNLSRVYAGQKNYKQALQFAKRAIQITGTIQNPKFHPRLNQHTYEVLSEVYYHLRKYDSAYTYLKKYMTLKDSLENKKFIWRLNMRLSDFRKSAEDANREARIHILDKDNQLKKQELKQATFVKYSLVSAIVILLLLGFFIFRTILLKKKNEKLLLQKRAELQLMESEKKQAEMQQKAVELEMQALRAQMNPHFIFNCLSSINRFIFKNDNKVASDYLTRFSRLIRMVLMHSQKKLIALEDELEMIRLYLELERLRFKDAFDYSITLTNIADAGTIFIPPLLLQPFCENAVWHGLMHKENKGHLNIVIAEITQDGSKTLACTVEDDGIGRAKAQELNSKSAGKEKSMGLKITTDRIALLNRDSSFNTFYTIEDILNDAQEVVGTRVMLNLKPKETAEEYA